MDQGSTGKPLSQPPAAGSGRTPARLVNDRQFRIVMALQIAIIVAVVGTGIIVLRSTSSLEDAGATTADLVTLYEAVDSLQGDLQSVSSSLDDIWSVANDAKKAAEAAAASAEDAAAAARDASDTAGRAVDAADSAYEAASSAEEYAGYICDQLNC